MGAKNAPLSLAVMYEAKQMYAEVDEKGRRRWSMLDIAAKLGISETSVLRAVRGQGRFGNIKNAPLPQTRTEQDWNQEAAESLARLQALQRLQTEADKTTRGDKMIEELKGKGEEVSEEMKQKLKDYLG